jgi:hypothetical protein
MPSAEVTAMILVGLEVNQISGSPSDRPAKIVFLHIHVEGIEHYIDSRISHLCDQLDRLTGSIAEVRFESVKRLDGKFHPLLHRVVACLLEPCDHPLNSCESIRLIDGLGHATSKDEGRTVNWASNDFCARGHGYIDATPLSRLGLRRAARLRSDGIDVTMDFQEPTKFVFLLGRFADLTLETRQGSERVTYESGNKQGSETLFDLPVTLTAPMTWETRKGTRFHLQKLDHPVINDANRKINSGDWKVIVSGQGDEYNSIMRDLGEPSFGDTGKTEYYGEIDLEATNK